MSRGESLFLAGEAAAVTAALRSNAKFRRYADDEVEEPLLEDFKALRRKLFSWHSWEEVDPLEYLNPFLEAVRNPEVNGPITLVALTSLERILRHGLLDAADGAAAAVAIQAVAESVTATRFEGSRAESDECVLKKILDVLVACVACPAGPLLSDDGLISLFQACYQVGHYQTEKGKDTSELLTQASRKSMNEMVQLIFSRLDAIPHPPDSPFARGSTAPPHAAPRLQVSPVPSRAATVLADEGEEEGQGPGKAPEAAGDAPDEASASAAAAAATEAQPRESEAGAEAAAAATDAADAQLATPSAQRGAEGAGGPEALTPATHSPPLASPATGEIVSLLPAVQGSPGGIAGYGVEAVYEVLAFIISLVATEPVGTHQDLPAHGLDLLASALQAAGPALEAHESLLGLLQRDLARAMFRAARQPSLACLAGICQVTLCLYAHLGPSMLLHVEALLGLLLLPLAEGRGAHGGVALEVQQAALEGVLDFCRQPGFVRDAYLNLDCRIERSNLFEQLCGLLSKTAFPVSGPLAAVHLQSLDGILAILSALAAPCSGVTDLDASAAPPLADPPAFLDVWSPLAAGVHPPLEPMLGGAAHGPAEAARAEKYLKGRLAAAADHFNRDQKKGFQYLQTLRLLPPQLDPASVAHFLRCCPGLAKAGIGEILGERDAFYEQVREAFMQTFDFTGLSFDTALRMFMDSFRPPGEGQKIDRIMQVFGRRYHEQMPAMGLRSADAAYVLAFSVIMLNTDLHNSQNKKKMSLEDFARINRSTNEGEPMPRPLLESIYASIARDELKISAESSADELPSVFWDQLALEARRPRGRMAPGASTNEALERDMFGMVWGPTLAAVSVVLDNATDSAAVLRALECLQLAARMAAYHQVDEVVDSIVAALAKFTAVLAPPRGAAALGESDKARGALEAMFYIANRYGDWLRSGWRNVMDAVLRLHRLDLLPPAVIAADGEDPEDARLRLPRPASISRGRGSSGSLLSRVITSVISIDGADGASAEQAAAREAELSARAAVAVEACHVEEVFADSKFLTAESLVELVKAVMWSAGNVAAAARSGEATAPAELCLELLVTLALRNRDRVGLVWPLLHEYLAAVTDKDNAPAVNPLVERAVLGLLRICQRLLPYKEDTADTLLRSLRLVIGLASAVSWELAERIAGEMLALLKSSAPYVRTEAGWRTVGHILHLCSARPEAAPLAYECLSVACSSPRALSGESFMPLLEVCLKFVEKYKQSNAEAAVQYLDLLEALVGWLLAQSPAAGGDAALTDEQLVSLWLTSMGVLAQTLATDGCQPLRDSAIMVLGRALQKSECLNLPPELWVQTFREFLVPVAADLARLASKKAKSHPGAEKSVRLAVAMLTKTTMQYLEVVQHDRDFYALWGAVLQALQDCMAVRHEAVQESVPENAKNMLLVMASSGILTPDWKDASGRSLWDLTFSRVHSISSGLNPGMLQSTLAPSSAPQTGKDAGPGPAAAGAPAAAAAAAAAPAAAGQAAEPANGPAPDAGSEQEGGRPAAPAAAGGAAETPGPAVRVLDGSDRSLSGSEGVRSHPISPEQLEDTPGSRGAASAAGPAAAAHLAGQGEPSSPQGGAAAPAAEAAPQGLPAAAGDEDEYSEEVQAEQSSSTCKQS